MGSRNAWLAYLRPLLCAHPDEQWRRTGSLSCVPQGPPQAQVYQLLGRCVCRPPSPSAASRPMTIFPLNLSVDNPSNNRTEEIGKNSHFTGRCTQGK